MNKTIPTPVFWLAMMVILIMGIGGAIALVIYLNPASPQISLDSLPPLTTQPTNLTLNLTSPKDHSLVFNADQLIQGQTDKGTIVILSTDKNDQLLSSDQSGNFSQMITLQEGVNFIKVASVNQAGQGLVEERIIYYSKEKI